MTKQLSVTLLSILLVLIVLFGVFTFLPDNISYGDYGVFHAPANLIQKGPDIGPSVTATYSVDTTDLEEGVLEIILYDDESCTKAARVLEERNYIVHVR